MNLRSIRLFCFLFIGIHFPNIFLPVVQAANIYTVSGGGVGDGGPAAGAQLSFPSVAVVDGSGNMYIADRLNHRVRKIDEATGMISTIAGSGTSGFTGEGELAVKAQFNIPYGVIRDQEGNLYISDHSNNVVRKIGRLTAEISTIAGNGSAGFSGDGGPGTEASLNGPGGLALDGGGGLYIADTNNNRIRKLDLASGVISTVAGGGNAGSGDGGPATSAQLYLPIGIALDEAGNIYIADSGSHRIRRVERATGTISTVAGTGTAGYSGDGGAATAAQLNSPSGITYAGGILYVADTNNDRIRRVMSGTIGTVAGGGTVTVDGGSALDARLVRPLGVYVAGGNLYIADTNQGRIRRVDLESGVISAVAGNGTLYYAGEEVQAIQARLYSPGGMSFNSTGDLYMADRANHRIRKVDKVSGVITTVAGTGTAGFGGDGGAAEQARMSTPYDLVFDVAGNLYFTDQGNHRVRKVEVATGVITTIAGTGTAGLFGDGGPSTQARLNSPSGLAIDVSGNLYIADRMNHRIRKIDMSTGIITTVAGSTPAGFGGSYSGDGGSAVQATLNRPLGISVNTAGDLFIADTENHRIRKVDAVTGVITTVAGGGSPNLDDGNLATNVALTAPPDVLADVLPDVLTDPPGAFYIADPATQRVRKVDVATGVITTVAGSRGNGGFSGDGGAATSALLNGPVALAIYGNGELFIADSRNNRIRKVSTENQPPFFYTQENLTLYEGTTDVVQVWTGGPEASDVISLDATSLPAFATLLDNGDGTGLVVASPAGSSAGSYSGITLSVSDGTKTVPQPLVITVIGANVPNQFPDGVIDTPAANTTITAGQGISFTGTGIDPDGYLPLSYLWDFGGGSPGQTVEDPGFVVFNVPGIYVVTFTVTDSFGLADPTPDSRIITVNAPNLAPDGVIDTPSGNVIVTAGQSVSFAGTGTDPDNNFPLSYLWNFGGGAPDQTIEDPGLVVFNTTGTYTVTLVVTDSKGLSDPTPDSRIVTVLQPSEIASIYITSLPQSIQINSASAPVTFTIRDANGNLISGTVALSSSSQTASFSTDGTNFGITTASFINGAGAVYFKDSTATVSTLTLSSGSVSTSQTEVVNAAGSGSTGKAYIFQIDLSPMTISASLPQTLSVRHWVLDQDGNPITTLTAADFPLGGVTILNTRTGTYLVSGTDFTIGSTGTHLGNGLYERTITLNSGPISGDLLILNVRLVDAIVTDNQILAASVAFNFGTTDPAGHRHVSVQPSAVTIPGNNTTVPSYTLKIRFYDQSGNLFNGGGGTFRLNRWRDSKGGAEEIGMIAAVFTNNEYIVTLSNITGMSTNTQQYVILKYTAGKIVYLIPFSLVALNPDPRDTIANPMFYNNPDLFETMVISNPPSNNAPVADNQSAVTPEDMTITLTLTGSDPDGDLLTFTIWTGPAHGTLGPVIPVDTTSVSLTYTPNLNFYGTDSFTFAVNDGQLTSSTAIVSIAISPVNDPPVAGLTASPLSGIMPLNVSFDASASRDVEGPIAGYAWNFGDTTTGSDITSSHTYTVAGTYTVTLTVMDSDGGTGSAQTLIKVNQALSAISITSLPQSVQVNATSAPVTFTAKDANGNPVSGTVTISSSSQTTSFSEDGIIFGISSVSFINGIGSFYFKDSIATVFTLTLSAGSVSFSQTEVVNAAGSGTAGKAHIFQVDVSPMTVSSSLPQTLILRYWVLDQDGNSITSLTAAAFPAGNVDILNTNSGATLIAGTDFTVGTNVTNLGNGLYERTITLNSGLLLGDLLILNARLADASATDNQRLDAGVAVNFGIEPAAGHRHVSVQPSAVTIPGNNTTVPNYTLKIRFYDQSGNLFDGGRGTFRINRWKDSKGGSEEVKAIDAVFADDEYIVTLSNITGMNTDTRQYVIVKYTAGKIIYLIPFSLTAVNPDPRDVISNPMFYNNAGLFR